MILISLGIAGYFLAWYTISTLVVDAREYIAESEKSKRPTRKDNIEAWVISLIGWWYFGLMFIFEDIKDKLK